MVDPILASVFARAFKSITDEMSISLTRTTRSPILCEAKDFVTGLYDAEGRMLECLGADAQPILRCARPDGSRVYWPMRLPAVERRFYPLR